MPQKWTNARDEEDSFNSTEQIVFFSTYSHLLLVSRGQRDFHLVGFPEPSRSVGCFLKAMAIDQQFSGLDF